ncbi:hypothetical protein L596_024085 [Steinernema carpocapsae]|uniref:Uncharacterized protein n=1 Tax=Steinernema carpocapsae TaxID=34508 RepID=A0A4U5MFN2_STECR|nr:hypothetical protein L596_024085 [Steinernema carpocapsae]
MSVVGFDLGNLNCYIAVAKQGGIEVITNDYSLHATPACVSYGSKNRAMGVNARQQVNTNFKSTVINFKQLIGRKFSDPVAQALRPYVPCEMVQLQEDNIGLKVHYLGQPRTLAPEQVMTALLVKLKQTTEHGVPEIKRVSDCVLSVPYYFTDVQRRSLLAAASMAELNCLRIVNENTATALAYGIYKQDLPEENESSKLVVFLDIGHVATQASLVAYNKGKLSMLGASYDLSVGGLHFDALIRNYFREMFLEKYKIDASKNPRAWLRLLDESERLKKQMSANSTPIPLNIECFMEDKDVSGNMQRSEFEEMAQPLFAKIRDVLVRLLQETGRKPGEIAEIEIIGGSSRIPMVRKIVKEIFGKDAKTTMNQDESVARGAALQCAILSPTFRVREFAVKDNQPYEIKLTWGNGEGTNTVFSKGDEFPFSKVITFYRKEPFQIEADYPNAVPHTINHIGSWKVNSITSTDNENRKVKVKVRVNPNGVFSICNATQYDTVVVPLEEQKQEVKPEGDDVPAPMETDGDFKSNPAPMEIGGEDKAKPAAMETDGDSKSTPAPMETEGEPKPKTMVIGTELPIDEITAVSFDVAQLTQLERDMQLVDLAEKRKADAKNAVEEYVYDMRDKLSGSYEEFVQPDEQEAFRAFLTTTEDWLYDEGEDAELAVYEQRMAELRKMGDPIVERVREHEQKQREAAEAAAGATEEAEKPTVPV